ncbi:PilZ domain-containing protein [Pseudooceanicola onchidii]|uniref:PilZ domain-containing protein n=1 Tax=Pseudooceanicola onchidii TaxID=2562279 RepID=UPI00145BF2FB|nr:PilZ domain-containing protein [Pseudooceanicola onchidii]
MGAVAQPTLASVRQFERIHVNLTGIAVFGGGATSVRVLDLSYGGARIELPLPADSYGATTIASLRVSQVLQMRVVWRWSRDRQMGVEFASPALARGAIAQLVAAQQPF